MGLKYKVSISENRNAAPRVMRNLSFPLCLNENQHSSLFTVLSFLTGYLLLAAVKSVDLGRISDQSIKNWHQNELIIHSEDQLFHKMSSAASSLIAPLHSPVTFEPVGLVTNVFFDDRNCQVRANATRSENFLLLNPFVYHVSIKMYYIMRC